MTSARAAAALLLTLPLGGCFWFGQPDTTAAVKGGAGFYERLESKEAKVNTAEAVSIISSYRTANGRGKLALSPRLTAIAQAQADAMARADTMSHTVGGSFPSRLSRGGYDAVAAAENIGAGYRSLAEAFSGWRGSPPHNANLLNREVTEMGIASAYAPGGKYKVYWALVLGKPKQ
jgi:uncharacterized protein YkwD